MEYKKKYEKLVDAVKVLRDNNPSDEGIQNWVNDNVPELESEDEKIKKEIIDYIKTGTYHKKWIAWLEKQGEQFDDNIITSSDERIRKAILEGLIDCRDAPDLGWSNFGGIEIDDCIAWLEKQGDKDKLIHELGEYKVKYIQETLEKTFAMNNKDDERLRKTTIAFLKDFADKGYENAVECITWLENKDIFSKKDVDDAYLKGVTDTKNEIEKQYEANYQIRKDIATFIFNYKGDIKDRAKWMNYLGIKVSFVKKQGEKQQGKSALEAIREEKVDNANKIEPKDYSSIDPYFGKPIDKVEPKFKVGDIVQYITDSTDRRKIEEIDTLCNMYHTDSLPIMFEIENDWKVVLNSENVEQNPSDKVEPKFHKGEWTVSKLDRKARQISEVHFDEYNSYYVVNGKEFNLKEYDRLHHSWTIQDAKDGDVLAFDNDTIVIFKDLYNSTSFHSYCHIEDGIFDFNKDGLPDWWNGEGFKPATKEQSDILFQKIKEAGYEWDAEKKELMKVEQNNTNCSDGL